MSAGAAIESTAAAPGLPVGGSPQPQDDTAVF
jgi:hypothetical protein